MRKRNQEIEIKLRVPDAVGLGLRLKKVKAQVVVPRTYESNTLYDTPSRNLTRHGQLIRIRIEQPSPNSHKDHSASSAEAVLTFKGPPEVRRASSPSRTQAGGRPRVKIRKGGEGKVADPEQMGNILRSLGFRPVFRYEKFRTTHML